MGISIKNPRITLPPHSQTLHLAPQIHRQFVATHFLESFSTDHQLIHHVVDNLRGQHEFLNAVFGNAGDKLSEEVSALAFYQLYRILQLCSEFLPQLPHQCSHLCHFCLNKCDEIAHGDIVCPQLVLFAH